MRAVAGRGECRSEIGASWGRMKLLSSILRANRMASSCRRAPEFRLIGRRRREWRRRRINKQIVVGALIMLGSGGSDGRRASLVARLSMTLDREQSSMGSSRSRINQRTSHEAKGRPLETNLISYGYFRRADGYGSAAAPSSGLIVILTSRRPSKRASISVRGNGDILVTDILLARLFLPQARTKFYRIF